MNQPSDSANTGSSRAALWLAAAGFGAIWLYRLVFAWRAAPESLVASMPDDAFYYFGIARSIAAGGGSTFDGVTLTNGYHPLWMVLCSTGRLISGGDDSTASLLFFARQMLTVELLLGLGAAIVLAVLATRSKSAGAPALVLAFLATPWCLYGMTDGVESGLVQAGCALFFLLCAVLKPFGSKPGAGDLAFGAALAMVALARLDLLLLAGSAGLVLLLRRRDLPLSARLAKLSAWMLPVALTTGIYLYLNTLHFDTAMPISGMLKSTFPRPGLNLTALREHIVPVALGVLVVLAGLIPAPRDEGTDEVRAGLAGARLFIVLHLVYTLAFSDWAVHRWHFTAYWMIAAMQGAVLLGCVPRLKGWMVAAMVAVLLAFSGWAQVRFFAGRTERAFQVQGLGAAEWARDNVGAGRLMGMSDCGVFGALRGGLVVNLDGVVNNRAYQETLAKSGIVRYAGDRGLAYIVHHAVDAGKVEEGYRTYSYRAYSHLYKKDAGALELRERDEVYRGPLFDDGTGPKRFMIWRWRGSEPRRGP